MCPRYIDDAQEVDFIRKTAVIDRELHRFNVDIAGLQETRLPDAGSIREDNYTFFWQGKSQDEPRLHGVGFAVKNALLDCTVPPSGGTERIIDLKICSSSGTVNILNVYAPTLSSSMEENDLFYDLLSDRIAKVPSTEPLYILGDFNARVGSDNDIWPNCLGHHGVGKMNENGQRLLEVCCFYGLCITNTYFQLKDQHKVSWRHPRSHHWHQRDLVIARRTGLKNVPLTRSYHSADCNTDHALVACTLWLTPKKCHHAKPRGHPRINTDHVHDTQRKQDFTSNFESAFTGNVQAERNVDKKWAKLSAAIYNSAVLAYGMKGKRNKDWYEQNLEEMEPVTEAKRKALLAYKRNPNERTREDLRKAKNRAQQTSRRCATNYWLNLCVGIQKAADSGNAKAMYDGIKKAIGPTVRKTAPLKSKMGEVITDEGKQMERWVEHYLELYAVENVVRKDACDAIKQMPVMEELYAMPTMEELSREIDSLANGKAPGEDGIPAEVIKYNKPVLLKHLYSLITTSWEEGYDPMNENLLRSVWEVEVPTKGSREATGAVQVSAGQLATFIPTGTNRHLRSAAAPDAPPLGAAGHTADDGVATPPLIPLEAASHRYRLCSHCAAAGAFITPSQGCHAAPRQASGLSPPLHHPHPHPHPPPQALSVRPRSDAATGRRRPAASRLSG
ncbi:uncharacterized protein LOC124796165 [Schistocerca piceifrons]|uniref:uncharacterized protein LOC124796165 n=1 Tax=Schistocerca piceifrons TaxID=274613 RepID=UPI001F5E6335|nr:uncharacterized protein LOC124796165 [Schistocerca piceifrons]